MSSGARRSGEHAAPRRGAAPEPAPRAASEATGFAQSLQIAAATAAAIYGVEPSAIAAALGGPPASAGDPVARVPHAAIVRCWGELARGRDDFGLQAARRLGVAQRTLVDYAMMSASDVGGALSTFVRFQRWMHDASSHRLEIAGDAAILRFAVAPPLRLPPALWDFLTATAALRVRMLAGADASPTRVHLARPPHEHEAGAAALFGAPVFYGAPEPAVVWPRSALRRPLVARDDTLHRLLARQLEVALSLPTGEGPVDERVADDQRVALRRVLASALLRGEVGLAVIARQLGTSARSLQRRLLADGTTFQAELDAARQALAERLLAEPGASVKAVAYAVGFAQLPAFTRAFRRWTGRAPADYLRARHAG